MLSALHRGIDDIVATVLASGGTWTPTGKETNDDIGRSVAIAYRVAHDVR